MRSKTTQQGIRPDNYKWLAFACMAIGTFMSTLDASIVNVALPRIQAGFNISLSTAQWVVMSYLLVITSILLTLGRLGDMIGRKRVYMLGVAVFTVGSACCGFAPSAALLILARALQGFGAAMITSMGSAIITDAFPPEQRGFALGMIGSVVAVGLTTGPVAGGLIVAHSSWRWIFFINIPIGILGLIFQGFMLRESAKREKERFDLPGAFLLFIGLVSLLLALTHGGEWNWSSFRVIGLFTAFAVFGLLFIWREATTEAPIFHLDLLRSRTFASGAGAAWISYVALFAIALYMSYYLQNVLGFDPSHAGMMLIAIPVSVSMVAPFSGMISDRIGSRLPASLGLAIGSVGLVLLSRLRVDSTWFDAVWRMAIVGFGSGLFQSPNSSSIMGSVPRHMLGVASGTVAMMRNLGMVSGIAIIGAVITSVQSQYLIKHPGMVKAAFTSGQTWGYAVAAGIAAIGVGVSLMREKHVAK